MTILKDFVLNYGAPTNGTSSCNAAAAAFKADQAGAVSQVILTIPPGTYNFTAAASGAAAHPFEGIPDLIVHMYGATITDNGGAGGIGFGSELAIPLAIPQAQARIESTVKGTQAITLATKADHTIFAIGNYIAVTSGDLQPGGQPPNAFNCEYRQITAKDTSTAVATLTLDAPLLETYLSTLPHYDSGSALQPDYGGPGTIYLMPPNWGQRREFRGGTININGGRQVYAKGLYSRFHDVVISGTGTIVPTANKFWALSGQLANFPGGEFDKLVEKVVIERGATMVQPFIQSSCGLLVIDNATVTTLNGTARRNIVRNGTIGTLKLGALGYGRTDYYDQQNGTIGAITWQPPQYPLSNYSISTGRVTTSSALPWGVPDTYLMFSGQYNSERGTKVTSATSAGLQTALVGGWPNLPGVTQKVGPHPCLRFRLRNVTGCAEAVDWSQIGAYDKPLGSYSKRSYSGLTNSTANIECWGTVTSVIVNVTSPAAGTLRVFGQFDNYPFLDTSYAGTTFVPTVDLSVAGSHVITVPAGLWATGTVNSFCTSTAAVFTIEIITDQGIDTGSPVFTLS